MVDWTSADYGAQSTALADLNTQMQIPWTQFLEDKADHVAAWWTDVGGGLHTTWAGDVNQE